MRETQIDLFNPPPRFRKSDPVSSAIAAADVERSGVAAAQSEEIYRTLLFLAFVDPATSRELAMRTTLDRYAVARRLPELRAAGRVENGEMRKCKVSGRVCQTWRAV